MVLYIIMIFNNYRPIVNIPLLGKLIEKVVVH